MVVEDSMSRKRVTVVLAVVAGIVILCTCAGTIGYLALNAPLGPALQIETQLPIVTPEIAPEASATASSSDSHPTASPTAGQAETCGEKGSVNILVMGVDSPFGDGFEGPLAIRLVKVDFSRKTANVFSFPRDLWISVKGLESQSVTQARLGRLYLLARSNAGYDEAAATNLVAQNLYQNFGAYSDHYIVGKMSTLAAIIDTVGGITIPVPIAHDATSWGMHYFPAGPYHMTGLLALEYAVTPTLAGQWDGWSRQTLVLSTLFKTILSPDILPKLPALIPQFLQVATTDLSLQQMLDLLCLSQQMPTTQIQFAEVEPGDVTFGPDGVQYPDVEAIRAKVRQNLGPDNP
jgi:anionic cell wall polymer biosynthesis LytR-Cps2A-Psr (LCP) family protein